MDNLIMNFARAWACKKPTHQLHTALHACSLWASTRNPSSTIHLLSPRGPTVSLPRPHRPATTALAAGELEFRRNKILIHIVYLLQSTDVHGGHMPLRLKHHLPAELVFLHNCTICCSHRILVTGYHHNHEIWQFPYSWPNNRRGGPCSCTMPWRSYQLNLWKLHTIGGLIDVTFVISILLDVQHGL